MTTASTSERLAQHTRAALDALESALEREPSSPGQSTADYQAYVRWYKDDFAPARKARRGGGNAGPDWTCPDCGVPLHRRCRPSCPNNE